MRIFLSHSSRDAAIADKICEQLEKNGIKCFIAPRDIRPGKEYAEEIINGIDESAAMILLMSQNANSSPHVLREVEHAVSGGTPILAPVYPPFLWQSRPSPQSRKLRQPPQISLLFAQRHVPGSCGRYALPPYPALCFSLSLHPAFRCPFRPDHAQKP